MKPKASTMQQRMGFADADLTSPKYDEIILWLVENMEFVAMNQCTAPEVDPVVEWRLQYVGEASKSDRDAVELKRTEEAGQQKPHFEIKLEQPITDRNFVIGFIDAVIYVHRPSLVAQFRRDEKTGCRKLQTYWSSELAHMFYIEVKPTTPSFGELLRQLRHYETYIKNPEIYVCSPDTRFKAALGQQGIGFITAPQ